jgi:hypothetical protein
MPFQDAKGDAQFADFEDGRYIVKLLKLEDLPLSELHPDWTPQMRWYFNVATYPDQQVLMGPNELPIEFWQYSSISMTPKSKARPWVEALLGRPLVDDVDKGEQITRDVLGRKAVALIGIGPNGKKAILSIQPFIDPKQNGNGPAPAEAPVSAAVATLEDDLPAAQRSPVAAGRS